MSDAKDNQVLWRGVQPVGGIQGVWPPRDAVRVSTSLSQVGIGTGVLYTVPADKKLFIGTGILSSRLAVAGSRYARMHVVDHVAAMKYTICSHFYDVAGQMSNNMRFFPALELIAAWSVRIYSDHANIDCEGTIHGWLEDA